MQSAYRNFKMLSVFDRTVSQVVRNTVSEILHNSTEFSWERICMPNVYHNFVMFFRLVSVTVIIVYELIWA